MWQLRILCYSSESLVPFGTRSFNKVQREFIFYVWLLAKSRAVMYFKKVLPIMMLEERNGGKTEFS